MPIHGHCAAAGILLNFIDTHSKMKWALASLTDFQTLNRKALNKSLRLAVSREPCRPDLHGHTSQIFVTAAAARIGQQVAKPPGAASVGQSHSKKTNFIAAARCQRREDFIQRLD